MACVYGSTAVVVQRELAPSPDPLQQGVRTQVGQRDCFRLSACEIGIAVHHLRKPKAGCQEAALSSEASQGDGQGSSKRTNIGPDLLGWQTVVLNGTGGWRRHGPLFRLCDQAQAQAHGDECDSDRPDGNCHALTSMGPRWYRRLS